MDLRQIVDDYEERNDLDWAMSDFTRRTYSVDDMIEKAVYTIQPDLKQRHKSYAKHDAARRQATEKLRKSLGMLGTPTSFEEVLDWVVDQTKDIPEFDKLGFYDTALGVSMYFGCTLPQDVHVHTGAQEGALTLFGQSRFQELVGLYRRNTDLKILSPSVFPSEIKDRLSPYQIENFLCDKRHALEKL